MYKMIAIDMDGTLLKNDKSVSHETYKAIQKAKDKGIAIVLSTGRPIEGVTDILNYLNLNNYDNYVISCSGALVQSVTGEILSENNLTIDDAKFLYNLSKKLNVNLNAVTFNSLLTPSFNFTTEVEAYITHLPVKIVDFNRMNETMVIRRIAFINETTNFIDRIKTIIGNRSTPMTYLIPQNNIYLDKNPDSFSLKDNIPQELYKNYTVLNPTLNTLEILNKNVNKGTGVAVVAEKLGIKKEEIICIGDSGNDIDMLKYAGLAVAMGNAFPEVKKIADYITFSNEEDGVAHVINKFILEIEEEAV